MMKSNLNSLQHRGVKNNTGVKQYKLFKNLTDLMTNRAETQTSNLS